jgi:hypothetical protein
MRMENLSEEQRTYYERQLLKGVGTVVQIKWIDLEEVETEVVEGKGKNKATVQKKEYKPVERVSDFYIGRLTAGQTGQVLAILIGMYSDGMALQQQFGVPDSIAFLHTLGNNQALTALLGAVMQTDSDWVDENFDTTWAVQVIDTFFKHNNFFEVASLLMSQLEKWGMSPEKMKGLLTKNLPLQSEDTVSPTSQAGSDTSTGA